MLDSVAGRFSIFDRLMGLPATVREVRVRASLAKSQQVAHTNRTFRRDCGLVDRDRFDLTAAKRELPRRACAAPRHSQRGPEHSLCGFFPRSNGRSGLARAV